MATIIETTRPEPLVEAEPEFPPHRMTIDRYRRLVESGVYGPSDPVFLWDGRLVEEMGKGDPHIFASSSLLVLLVRLIPAGWAVRHEQPIRLVNDGMPEPDLSVARGDFRDYLHGPPSAHDLGLVIEVSDSSLPQDSITKLRAYAAEGIPTYWIINIRAGRVEVYGNPTGPAETPSYRDRRDYGPGEEIPVVLDSREVGRVAVGEILP